MIRIPRLAATLQSFIKIYPQYARIAGLRTNLNCSYFRVTRSFATLKPSFDEDSDLFQGQAE